MFDHGHVVGLGAGETDWGYSGDDALGVEEIFDLTTAELAVLAGADVTARWSLPDVEWLAAGPVLGLVIDSIDRSRLNGHDLVRLIKARERMISHHQGVQMAEITEMAHSAAGDADSEVERVEEAFLYVADELRAALALTRRAAETRTDLALTLTGRLPRVHDALGQSVIDLARARVIETGTCHLPADEARQIADIVLERAARLTTGQLAAWIRKLCVETRPDDARDRYDRAVDERRLWIEATDSGTGNIHILDIPLPTVAAIGRRVNGYMIALKKAEDSRTHDQIRADIICDLILGNRLGSANSRGTVHLNIDLTTLAALDDKPGELPGLGPLVADIARQTAETMTKASWEYMVTDENGETVATGVTRRRPTTAQHRQVTAADTTCVFPGCRVPAHACDLDHLDPYAQGGPTTVTNLKPKCRHDHVLKDHGWTHIFQNGRHRWTSPLGHTYTTEKPP